MLRAPLVAFVSLVVLASAPARAITIEQAMADPDWIGSPVQHPYWSVDGRSLYYSLKRKGSQIRDLHRIDIADGKDVVVDPAAMAGADGADPVFDRAHARAAFVRNGDVFIRDVTSGRLTQVTRTEQSESSPQFSADGRALHYRSGNDWFVYDIAGGVGGPAAILRTEKDPESKKPDDLGELQLKLFSTLREIKDDREAAKKNDEAFAKADQSRAPKPFYVGEDVKIEGTSLGPDGRWMVVFTSPKNYDKGKAGKLQHFVTESGYEDQEDERTRVGRNDPAPQSMLLLDLLAHEQYKLAASDLPGIHDDPLKAVREENEKAGSSKKSDEASAKTDGDAHKKSEKKDAESTKPKERAIRIVSRAEDGGGGGVEWSEDGRSLAIQIRAIDNKDRWITTVDFGAHKLLTQHRLTDPAWINWNFNEFGWEKDNRTLWYVSEETGFAQLYAKTPGGKASALTKGAFEVSSPALTPDGKWFYLRANAEAPTSYDVYRVAVGGGALQRMTSIKGMQEFLLAPDGKQLAIVRSSAYVPPQLAVASAEGGDVRDLTDTRTTEYKAIAWPEVKFVEVPSTHTKQPIYSKFYLPKDFDASKKYPAVMFVHGAGYTQNTDHYWPYYFREQMFHNLLNEHGYVVLDMDYRASEGYGRDWRTAIYRQMGHPELEDLVDGVHWLIKNYSVDPNRIGVYGGSYGGFMTLIAMFRAPDVFKAGAALRPVTDWTQYNHEYTSNILNDPAVDPIAYERSSPIEFADGLKGHLLIAHGMIDDNVLFEDSARLYQKLIELHKDNFEISPYPMERHGFVHADSWLDEYKRIYRLFEDNLK